MLSRIVVHYGEIGTKGGNRQEFESTLRRNILSALNAAGNVQVRMADNRFLVLVDEDKAQEAKARLARIFGVVWFAQVEGAKLAYQDILETSLRVLVNYGRESTFRVRVRRANKAFEMTSQELAGQLGEDIIERLGLRVNLSAPDVTLSVDVISREALVYTEHLKGPGGLPLGSSGAVLHLLSGGIDSPVGAWLMMKRGCRPVYLHFYVAPSAEEVVGSKVGQLLRILTPAGNESQLILVPFSPYQVATLNLPPEFEPIVFRRFMRMVAERLAWRLGLPAISTGDNLAQVASQTLQNIASIDSGCSLPTLRPLLGYDKDEIIQLARRVGTYETSILEYKDCCSIISRHPRTRMKVDEVDEAARRHGFEELSTSCVSMASIATFGEGSVNVRPLSEIIGNEEGRAGLTQAPSQQP